MKNSLISISLFIILIGFLFYADYSFKSLCSDIIQVCDVMEDNLGPENKDNNFEESMKLFDMIQEKDMIASIYINHMDYDVILNEALKLSVYIEKEDFCEADASLHILKYSAEHLKNIQVPNIKNLF